MTLPYFGMGKGYAGVAIIVENIWKKYQKMNSMNQTYF